MRCGVEEKRFARRSHFRSVSAACVKKRKEEKLFYCSCCMGIFFYCTQNFSVNVVVLDIFFHIPTAAVDEERLCVYRLREEKTNMYIHKINYVQMVKQK